MPKQHTHAFLFTIVTHKYTPLHPSYTSWGTANCTVGTQVSKFVQLNTHTFFFTATSLLCASNDDVVDGNKDQLHSVPNEPHNGKANCARGCDFFKLLGVWLVASLQQSTRRIGKLGELLYVFHLKTSCTKMHTKICKEKCSIISKNV